jgi:hypothetical protein
VAVLKAHGCTVHRRNTGMQVAEYKGKTRVIRYGSKGAADLHGYFPNLVAFELEVKRDGERPRLDQVQFLRSQRCPAWWIDDADELRKVLPLIIAGARIAWEDGEEEYTVEAKGPDGKKVRLKVMGPSAEFYVERGTR